MGKAVSLRVSLVLVTAGRQWEVQRKFWNMGSLLVLSVGREVRDVVGLSNVQTASVIRDDWGIVGFL